MVLTFKWRAATVVDEMGAENLSLDLETFIAKKKSYTVATKAFFFAVMGCLRALSVRYF
jgi:hypothetical protein